MEQALQDILQATDCPDWVAASHGVWGGTEPDWLKELSSDTNQDNSAEPQPPVDDGRNLTVVAKWRTVVRFLPI